MARDESRKPKILSKPFEWETNDPLVQSHEAVDQLIRDILKDDPRNTNEDFTNRPAVQAILALSPDEMMPILRAMIARLTHVDEQAQAVQNSIEDEMARINWHCTPEWYKLWPQRTIMLSVVKSAMRRKLPFDAKDLENIAHWITLYKSVNSYIHPIKFYAKAVTDFAAKNRVTPGLAKQLRELARAIRERPGQRDVVRLADQFENLPGVKEQAAPDEPAVDKKQSAAAFKEARTPASAGNPAVLLSLKKSLKLADVPDAAIETIGPDRFPLRADSPLRKEHELLSELIAQAVGTRDYHSPKLESSPAGQSILKMDDRARARVLLADAERVIAANAAGSDLSDTQFWQAKYAAIGLFGELADQVRSFERDELFDILLFIGAMREPKWMMTSRHLNLLLSDLHRHVAEKPLTPAERHVLHRLRAVSVLTPQMNQPTSFFARLNALVGDGLILALVPGEAWSDAVNEALTQMPPARRDKWIALLKHAATATAARPTAKWEQAAEKLVKGVGDKALAESLVNWFGLATVKRSVPLFCDHPHSTTDVNGLMNDGNATCLRGLLWMTKSFSNDGDLTRAIGKLAISCYQKVPGVGPRAVKVGNAAVYALSQVQSEAALGQLAVLRVKVRFGTAQKEIEKALNSLAESLKLPRADIEEMGVPAYGLEAGGVRRETLGDVTAEIRIDGSDADLHFIAASGNALKSVPASVKKDHAEELADLKAALKDIQQMLPAQRDRIDSLMISTKTWPYETWRERYLEHPLIGTIARRLIWTIDGAPALFADGKPTNVSGRPVSAKADAKVALWHPVGRAVDEVVAWRARLADLKIVQPFKQAHREVYILTDAERNTQTYSNRFAAHIIRQHQFNALCAARGWKNKLRLMVDDVYPPASRLLPEYSLRAEFWIEGIGEDYGADTNESGVYLRLATDQVRFYRIGDAQRLAHAGGGGYAPRQGDDDQPIPLEQVPPLAFSEIMRDVDLFVGVGSVGNDPAWQDGGPQGRFREYWANYSFGDLSATAQTRKTVLESLLPRLKIRDRASLSERFLVVKGNLRTYKIHLGSGNILMEPNDQYLCIVQSRSSADHGLFLPFEGDNTLAVILSKAFLLAADDKITDPTITRQINAKG